MTEEEVAMGFIRVANEAMCRPIRALTQVICKTLLFVQVVMIIIVFIFHAGIFIKAKGHDTSQHVLACFGGAGRQINLINVCPFLLVYK